MKHLNATNILLAVSGLLIHLLMTALARKTKAKGENKFSIKVLFLDPLNWIRIVLAGISTAVLLVMLDDAAKFLGITLPDGSAAEGVFAFLAGYLNKSIIRKILKIFAKSK